MRRRKRTKQWGKIAIEIKERVGKTERASGDKEFKSELGKNDWMGGQRCPFRTSIHM